MNCLRCGKKIPKRRHVCDECKKRSAERDKKRIILSPNNSGVKKDRFRLKATILALVCIGIAIALCFWITFIRK